jgi:hypothetical protein
MPQFSMGGSCRTTEMSLAGKPARSEVANQGLVEVPFRGWKSPGERGDLDERVALAGSGGSLEVFRIVFDHPLGAIVVGYAERLDKGIVHPIEEPLPFGERPSPDDLDPN